MITLDRYMNYRYINTTLFMINSNSRVVFSVSPIRTVRNSKQLFYNEYISNGMVYGTINIDWFIRIVSFNEGNVTSFSIMPSNIYHFIKALHEAIEWVNGDKFNKLFRRNKMNGLVEINPDVKITPIRVFNVYDDYMDIAPALMPSIINNNDRDPAIGFYFKNNLEGIYIGTQVFLSFVYLMDKLDPYNLALNTLMLHNFIDINSSSQTYNTNKAINNSNFFDRVGAKKND